MSTSKRNKTARVTATRKYYDAKAEEWSAAKSNSFHHEKEFRTFVSLLKPDASVLDVGCAGGILVPLFLGIGRSLSYHGIDFSKSFLKIAQRRYPQLNFTHADISDPRTLPETMFDGFIMAAVLMHLPLEMWETACIGIDDHMRAGSIGYVTLPVAHPSGDAASDDPRQFTILSEAEHKKFFKKIGWRVRKTITKNGSRGAPLWRGYIVELP